MAAVLLATAGAARAEVSLTGATPGPAYPGLLVTLSGTADCAQVFVLSGDPLDIAGTLVNVNGATQTFTHTHAYPGSGSYMAEVFQIAGGGCVTADANSADNFLTVTVLDAGAVSTQSVGPTAVGPAGAFAATPLALAVEHIELYFDSGSARTAVARNRHDLKLHARLRYRGTGLLRAVWEVDGRRHAYVTEYLNYGDSVTLSTPEAPELPTFSPGPHRVSLRVLEPATSTAPPVAFYFVDSASAAQPPPTPLGPADDSTLGDDATEFRWSSGAPDTQYRVDFFSADPSAPGAPAPLFSAYTNAPEYTLTSGAVANFFVPGQTYWWQVAAVEVKTGKTGAVAATAGRVKVPEPKTRVSGQVVVVTAAGVDPAEQLGSFALRELESYELDALRLRVGVYETDRDLSPLVAELQRVPDVKLAQPNFVFRTSGDPLASMQAVQRRLHLDAVHAQHRGKSARVAVIDSGVDAHHPDLRARVAVRKNFVSGGDAAAEIHGTAVAGVIAASADGFGITGVAPEAALFALRACAQSRPNVPDAQCTSSSVARALDFALQQGAQLVNMSFGTPETDPLIETLLNEGERRGALFVAPVGNARWQEQASFPARHPAVIAVGGVDDRGAPYPNPKLAAQARVSAPATQVFSTVPGDRHNFLDGTSFASATVSGILALAIDKQAAARRVEIPPFTGDLCAWQAALLEMDVCK